MVEKNEEDRRRCEQVTKDSNNGIAYGIPDGKNGKTTFSFLAEMMFQDSMTDGFLMHMPYGNVIKQAQRSHYYRGENQIYPKSMPSLNRLLANCVNQVEREKLQFVADMRIYEFKKFIYQFECVKNWKNETGADVLYEMLAQHYGIETHWLDITNDFLIALFFATCYYDWEKKMWKPLNSKMTDCSEEKKYGVIYHIPQEHVDLNGLSVMGENKNCNSIWPIGYQPFMRCSMQTGYGIYMREDKPLQEDIQFEKLRFRHSEKISEWIYDKMLQGKKVYPNEGISEFDDVIQKLRSTKKFSKEAYDYAMEQNANCNKDFYKELVAVGIEISQQSKDFSVSRQRIRCLERKYKKQRNSKPDNIFFRPIIKPTNTK